MSDLRNQTPSTTYKGLLQVNDYSNGVDATSKFVQDGEGTNSALSISTTKVGVGTSSPSAPLDVTSTSGGVVFPRLTTTQRDAISNPTNGETIYNTTTTQVESYNGSDWVAGGTTVVANNAVTSNSIANDAIITDKINNAAVTTAKIANDAVTTAKIADDAVTPAKLDDTQVYEALGFRTNGESFIAQGTAAGGIGIRFDKTNNPSPTGQIDLFVDVNGALQITAPQNAVADRPLATLSNGSDLSVYGTVTGTNIVESSGSLNQVVRSSSSANLGYVIMYSGGEALNQKRVNLVPDGGKFVLSWVNDDTTAGLAVQLDQATGAWEANSDNAQNLGSSSNRWDNVYATNGTIQVSDRNEKEEIEDLSEAELRVATAIKGLIKKFKFKGRVRKHIGVIAQDVEAAFTAEGLNASEYGLFCSDTFEDEDGNSVTRLGIRYEELLAFIISVM
jgi:hypothetical protein